MSGGVECLLWDFGDTLCHERFFHEVPSDVPGWPAAWDALEPRGVHDQWYRGELSTADVARLVAGELECEPAAIERMMRRACRGIREIEGAFEFARARRLPQAIVTVNPDLFTTDIVPALELDRWFDPIVTSWEERTLDKAELCDVALSRMPGGFVRARALLIDNKEANVEGWRRRGGRGYVFRGGERFARDLGRGGVEGLGS